MLVLKGLYMSRKADRPLTHASRLRPSTSLSATCSERASGWNVPCWTSAISRPLDYKGVAYLDAWVPIGFRPFLVLRRTFSPPTF